MNPGGSFPPEALTEDSEITEEPEAVDESCDETEVEAPFQSVEKVAAEVAQGRWGVGQARRAALSRAGYDANEVEKEAKKILNRR